MREEGTCVGCCCDSVQSGAGRAAPPGGLLHTGSSPHARSEFTNTVYTADGFRHFFARCGLRLRVARRAVKCESSRCSREHSRVAIQTTAHSGV